MNKVNAAVLDKIVNRAGNKVDMIKRLNGRNEFVA